MVRVRCMVGAILVVPFLSAYAEAENPRQEQNAELKQLAIASAQVWLALVDEGDYEKSWETAADYFKQAITKEQWNQSLHAARTPLGALISRDVRSATYATELPGAPDGEYVVIQFGTSFKGKKSAIETVTPMREGDGSWRVSGYYIK